MGERRGTRGLELWCRRMTQGYPGVEVINMTTSWRDGMAFCAIIHHFRPDLIDFSKLNKDDIYYNNELAFQTAERHLGIPALLEPEDMVEFAVPDRLSILTYLSQFYQTFSSGGSSPSRTSIIPPASSTGGSAIPTATTPTTPTSFIKKSPISRAGSMSPDSGTSSPNAVATATVTPRVVVGKSRREPCTSCGLPVFIAERLHVGKQLYHRTCFRCARCNSQLTLANYYETEATPGQFCCETCPDEEKIGTLNRSVSDDEKSADLRRLVEETDDTNPHSTENEGSSKLDRLESSGEDDSEDEVVPPDLPKSPPPDQTRVLPSESEHSVNSIGSVNLSDNQPKTATDEKQLETKLVTKEEVSICGESKEAHVVQPVIDSSPPTIGGEVDNPLVENNPVSVAKSETPVDFAKDLDHSNKEPLDVSTPEKSTELGEFKDEYPDDLNPFGDDDEPKRSLSKTKPAVSLNPFGDDESDTEPKTPIPVARKRIKSKEKKIDISVTCDASRHDSSNVSLNPFWSDGEEPTDDEDDKKTQPVSTTQWNVSTPPQPKPRTTLLSPKIRRSYDNISISSNQSSMSYDTVGRKKKLAPPPPPQANAERRDSTHSSLTSTPSSSAHPSPKSTPKIRKQRRAPLPPLASSPTKPPVIAETNSDSKDSSSTDLKCVENEKSVKDQLNRDRQSWTDNKSTHGKWKRRKGQAPSRPIPQRRFIKPLPEQEIRNELQFIEIQQQGLEKQGVRLETMIREQCEGPADIAEQPLSPDVEDLILQLFELVNEKNELFRKQTELMYLRRQQRLEEEHAELEYQIRCLMLKPESTKTDSDKAKEEELIGRLIDIVERRNEIVHCLDMERVREAEEDVSISHQLNLYTLKREENAAATKAVHKEKKKKEKKKDKKFKMGLKKKGDADKDIDESEVVVVEKIKKKKKFAIF